MRLFVQLFMGFVLTLSVAACRAEEQTQKEPLLSLPFLAVDLDGDGIEIIPLEESNVYFDVDGDGLAERTAWIHPDDGFINMATRASFREKSTYKRVLDLMTDGIYKAKSYDKNSDGVFDTKDYNHNKNHVSSDLSFFIARDTDSDGMIEGKRHDIITCNAPILHYPQTPEKMSLEHSVQCQEGQQLTYKVIQFPYEDSNILWRSLCKRLQKVSNREGRVEYQFRCVDQGYNPKEKE